MKLTAAVLAGLASVATAQTYGAVGMTRPAVGARPVIGGNPATWTPTTTRPIGGNPATWTPTTTRPIGGNPATWTPTTTRPIGGNPATWTPTTTTTSALGSNKCTWGPSYWCASEANAKECNYDFANCADGADDTFSATIVQPKGKGEKKGRATVPGGTHWNGNSWGPEEAAVEPSTEEVADWVMTLPESDPLVKEISESVTTTTTTTTTDFTIEDCKKGRDFICSSAEAAKYCNYEFSKCTEVRPTIRYTQATTTTATTLPATTTTVVAGANGVAAVRRPVSTTTATATTLPATYRPTYTTSGSATTYRPTYTTSVGSATTYRPATTTTVATTGVAAVGRPFGDQHSMMGHTDVYRTGVATRPAYTTVG